MLVQLARALEAADPTAVLATMAEDVALHVAVHDEPFEGLAAASHILGTVLDGVLHDIEVTEMIEGRAGAVLMFGARVAGQPRASDGLLVVRSNPEGRISDLTVFLRPLAALQAMADEMGRRLDSPRPDGGT